MKILKVFSQIGFTATSAIDVLNGVMLWLVLKPALKLVKYLVSDDIYIKINFYLIEVTNIIFFYNKKKLMPLIQAQHDLRRFRDCNDKIGIDLYYNLLSPRILFKNKTILDLGCGVGGKDLEILKAHPKKIIGIDLSSRNIKLAQELINRDNRSKLRFERKDILDFKDEKVFDTVISFTVFEHIDKNDLLNILNKISRIIKPEGKVLIVYNHYNDRFGSHLKEYIYHPWPQSIFEERILFRFWNKQLHNDPKITEDSYFPKTYEHGIDNHNSDCFMNLNKLSIKDFERIIKKSNLNLICRYDYSKSIFLKVFPFLPKKYLEGSAIYYLTRVQSRRTRPIGREE